ncbi:hypothetical protein HNR46_002378 [Haloferula luteola]|uniref:Uncharacterized protein n=1 Tax=Haloferula luteola TaxID=595692 RepID=A0A840V1B2_9BACT|nr:hypothetical protein [Haloferula luteola]
MTAAMNFPKDQRRFVGIARAGTKGEALHLGKANFPTTGTVFYRASPTPIRKNVGNLSSPPENPVAFFKSGVTLKREIRDIYPNFRDEIEAEPHPVHL